MTEKMYLLRMERDDDGKWGYDKEKEIFISADKREVFESAVAELKQMRTTLRGRPYYTEKIMESLNSFIPLLESEVMEWYGTYNDDWENTFDKKTWDIQYGFEDGNARFYLRIEKIVLTQTKTSISFMKDDD